MTYKFEMSAVESRPIGDASRFYYCQRKLERDVVIARVTVDTKILTHSELQLLATSLDKLGHIGA